MRVSCGNADRMQLAVKHSQAELFSRIRDQVDVEGRYEELFTDPEFYLKDSGEYMLGPLGIGYWEQGGFACANTPAAGTYDDAIVHDHPNGNPKPPRLFFEGAWTASFSGDNVRMEHGSLSFEIPHDGLWAVNENALS